jgi:hypothetical protein
VVSAARLIYVKLEKEKSRIENEKLQKERNERVAIADARVAVQIAEHNRKGRVEAAEVEERTAALILRNNEALARKSETDLALAEQKRKIAEATRTLIQWSALVFLSFIVQRIVQISYTFTCLTPHSLADPSGL